jgi:hypothetical protein
VRDQRGAGPHDNSRRPTPAERGNHPQAAELQRSKEGKEQPRRCGLGWYEHQRRRQPAGVKCDEPRIAVAVDLDRSEVSQPARIGGGERQFGAALQRDKPDDRVERAH